MNSNAGEVALIVDDEEEICLLLRGFLLRKFKRVEIATTLKQGLEIAKILKPSVLFLDNNLPDGQGINSISLFRMYVEKIIIISAMTNLADISLSRGANYFIAKPISFRSIESLIC